MKHMKTILTLAAAATLVGLVLPSTALAIPAWARKYGASCTLCHYPNIPRLSSAGERFRRAGYRMPDEIGKDQEITKVGNFLAARGRVRYDAKFPDHGDNTNSFQLSDATFFYAGAFSQHFSAFVENEIGQDGDIDLLASAHGILGEAGNYATVRVGQMHTLTRVGFGGLDRPTGITATKLFGKLTTSKVPFQLGTDQKGLEIAYVYQDSRLLAQVLNGVDNSSGLQKGNDGDQDKDYLVAFEQIIDDIASGVSVFAYRGFFHDRTAAPGFQRYAFWRLGATGNKLIDLGDVVPLNLDIMAGYVRSEDEVPSAPNISGNAFFVELQQYFRDLGCTTFERYDYINPQLGHVEDERHIGTIGIVAPLEEYVRVALEGSITSFDQGSTPRRIVDPNRDLNDREVLAEVQFNF